MGENLVGNFITLPHYFSLGSHCPLWEFQVQAKRGPRCQLLGQEDMEAAKAHVDCVPNYFPARLAIPWNDAPEGQLRREPGIATTPRLPLGPLHG